MQSVKLLWRSKVRVKGFDERIRWSQLLGTISASASATYLIFSWREPVWRLRRPSIIHIRIWEHVGSERRTAMRGPEFVGIGMSTELAAGSPVYRITRRRLCALQCALRAAQLL